MKSGKRVDVAVLGLGTMGTFACLEAARRKATVVGFDRFAPPHERGSHTGDTRVFREAYGEFPDYVPLAQQASRMWDELGGEAGQVFLHRCGMLNVGQEHSVLITGIAKAAERYRLPVETLSPREISQRFPGYAPPEDSIGIYEKMAGWVDVKSALAFGLERAAALGAELKMNTAIERFEEDGNGFRIETATGQFFADKLVVTAGAGAVGLLDGLRLPLKILRKVLIWVKPLKPELFTPERFPMFSFSDRFLYGFPQVDERGVKIAVHWAHNERETTAEDLQPPAAEEEMIPALQAAAELLPELAGSGPEAVRRVTDSKTCLYTMTPDEGFIVGRHPSYENAFIATGFSGHGFKFAPALGSALADLALKGSTAMPIGPMALGERFLKAR